MATLIGVFGDIDLAEDAVQEAFGVALLKWPSDGLPPNPRGWITTTARKRAIDRLRRESRERELLGEVAALSSSNAYPGVPEEVGAVQDDRLRLIFTCCHPALSTEAQVALTLRLLGGLTAGLVLRDVGCDVRVFERSSAALEARGAGIAVLDDTVRYLVQRRVLDVDQVCSTTGWVRYLHPNGSTRYKEKRRYRFSSWTTIYRALLSCFPLDRYHLGREIVGFDQGHGAVVVRFADRTTYTCDLLVCADGIDSSARQLLLPGVVPCQAGYVAWRGTLPEHDLSADTFRVLPDAITYQILEHSHILMYPVPNLEGAIEPGRRLMNFVQYRNVPEGEQLEALMLDRQGRQRLVSLPSGSVQQRFVEELLAFAAAEMAPPIAEVVRQRVEPFVQVIFDVAVPAGPCRRASRSSGGHAHCAREPAGGDLRTLRQRPSVHGAAAGWRPTGLEPPGRLERHRLAAVPPRRQHRGARVGLLHGGPTRACTTDPGIESVPLLHAATSFARDVATGARVMATGLGLHLATREFVPGAAKAMAAGLPAADLVLVVGGFEDELVAARVLLGTARDGLLGPTQWIPDVVAVPDGGPDVAWFVQRYKERTGRVVPSYPAAQAFAAGLLVARCVREVALAGLRVDDQSLFTCATQLACATLYGGFSLDPQMGRQRGHALLTVQW